MKKIAGFSVILSVVFFAFSAGAADFEVSSFDLRRGDTAIIYFKDENLSVKSAEFNGQQVSFFKYKNQYVAVFGIAAAKKPGTYPLKIVFADGKTFEKDFVVKGGKAVRVALDITKQVGLTPQGLVNKLQEKKKNLESVFDLKSEDIFFNQPFGLPLKDNTKIGSRFGEIRVTGGNEIRHVGMDLKAPLKAAVAAINKGIVRKAYNDSVYGNTVIIDHGHGIFSTYLHLDSIKASEGKNVKKGEIIGFVGQTGYASGPHLHLSVKINSVSVDPLRFVRAFK